jgi:hypothetical protein
MRLLPIVIFLAACAGEGDPCGDGFGKADDGNCYPLADLSDPCEEGYGRAADGNCYALDDGNGFEDTGNDTDTNTGTGGGGTGGGGSGGTGGTGGTGGGGGGTGGGGTGGTGGTGGGGGPPPCSGTTITVGGTFATSRAPVSGGRCLVLGFETSSPSGGPPTGALEITCPTGTSPVSFEGEICVGTASSVYFLGSVDESGTISDAQDALNPRSVSSGSITDLSFNITLR